MLIAASVMLVNGGEEQGPGNSALTKSEGLRLGSQAGVGFACPFRILGVSARCCGWQVGSRTFGMERWQSNDTQTVLLSAQALEMAAYCMLIENVVARTTKGLAHERMPPSKDSDSDLTWYSSPMLW